MTKAELDDIRTRLDSVPRIPWNASLIRCLNDDARTLLAEVERLTGERDTAMDRMQQAIIDLLNEHNAPLPLIARVVEMEYP